MSLSLVFSRRTLWLILCGLVAAPGSTASGQDVYFSNTRPFVTSADRRVYANDGLPLVGDNFVAQLYYGASADSLTPVTAGPLPFRNVSRTDPLAGTWVGAQRALSGMAPDQVAILQVRAWDATGGLSIEEAKLLGRQWGESATFTYQIPSMGPDILWQMEEFRSFSLVPEPSVIILALVGALAMFVLARRNDEGRARCPSAPPQEA